MVYCFKKEGGGFVIKTVAVVSLSAGTLGESFARHELDIGLRRLEKYGLHVKLAPHALAGIEHLKNHPEDRAADLLWALHDTETDMILCAIGGDDTYRLAPFLFENDALRSAAAGSGKVFLGFSDTTVNHMMLHKVGMNTFYGQSFLSDVCELDTEMLPYTRRYFEELLQTGRIREVTPSDVWYEARTDFGESRVGTPNPSHPDGGFVLLQGAARFSGKILGGCIDTLFDFFDGGRYADMRRSAKPTVFSLRRKTGRGRSSFWNRARNICRRKNTGRRCGISKPPGCSPPCPACWSESR